MKTLLSFISIFYCSLAVGQLYEGFAFGRGQDEVGYDFVSNSDGSFDILFSSRSTSSTSEDYVISHIDSLKNFNWINFETIGPDHPYSLIKTLDNGYLVSGTRWDFGFIRNDMILIKLNELFQIEWTNYYGGDNRDFGFNAIESKHGGYIFTGTTNSNENFEIGDFYLIKTNANGSVIWEKSFGHIDQKDHLFDLKEDRSGNIYSVGMKAGYYNYSTFDFKDTLAKATVIKFDSSGNKLWEKYLGSKYNNSWYKEIEINSAGEIFAVGSTQEHTAGSFDILLSKFNQNGDLLWEKRFGDIEFDYGSSMCLGENNSLYITGSTCNNFDNFSTDIKVIKTDLEGGLIWDKNFGGDKSEYSNRIKLTPKGIAVLGYTESYGYGKKDNYLLELNHNGEVLYTDKINSQNSELIIYPNPSSSKINIILTESNNCTKNPAEIIDASGKTLTFINFENSNSKEFDVSNFADGLYFVKHTSSCTNNTVISKFIVR